MIVQVLVANVIWDDYTYHANTSVIDHFPVATFVNSLVQQTALLVQSSVKTTASIVGVLRNVTSLVSHVENLVNGNVGIFVAMQLVVRCVIAHRVRFHARKTYPVVTSVSGFVVKTVHLFVVSVTKKRFVKYFLGPKMRKMLVLFS